MDNESSLPTCAKRLQLEHADLYTVSKSFSCPRHSSCFGRSSGSFAPLDRSIIDGYCRHAQAHTGTHPKHRVRVFEVPVSGSDLQPTRIAHGKMFSGNMSKP